MFILSVSQNSQCQNIMLFSLMVTTSWWMFLWLFGGNSWLTIKSTSTSLKHNMQLHFSIFNQNHDVSLPLLLLTLTQPKSNNMWEENPVLQCQNPGAKLLTMTSTHNLCHFLYKTVKSVVFLLHYFSPSLYKKYTTGN